jgi:cytochrome c
MNNLRVEADNLMTHSRAVFTGGGLLVLLANMAVAAGDPARGALAFGACMACHSVKPGDHMTGPSLASVWNRKAGTVKGFSRYSDSLKGVDVVWNDGNLDKWLADPERLIPGNTMTFPWIKGAQEREDIIAYLKAVSENKAPAAGQQGNGMRAHGTKLNLRTAPPEGQVTAIRYCGDTYTVRTADEKSQKVWEFNLRFKTDSSKEGPLPGKPVIVGAGMQGDRASVVFASPSEISSFIKPACP